MASRAKHERNEKRKIEVSIHKQDLQLKKQKLADSCKIGYYKNIIINIQNKLENSILTQNQKDVLNNEKQIYEKKINDNILDDISNESYSNRWKLRFEMNKIGKELGCCKIRRRCNIPTCSRPRSIYKKFGLCRLHIREYAGKRLLSGRIRQESW